MIRFEINDLPFELTNAQWATATGMMGRDWTLDYDIVEGDTDGIIWLWQHAHSGEGNPIRHWIEADGSISLSEDVDWDWNNRGVGTPTPPETDKE